MIYREFRAMDTDILLAAEGAKESIQSGFDRVQGFIFESENRFTRFSSDSELSRLNDSAGAWFEASEDMFDVITQAIRLHHDTQSLFDPAILPALEYAGYDRTIEDVQTYGAAVMERPLKMKSRRGFKDIQLEPNGHRIKLPENLRIDLGGIVKGWIAEQAAWILSNYARTCAVDAGGDAFLIGLPVGEDSWRITLEDPNEPGKGLTVLNVKPGAIATSTITRRRWRQGGQTRHHLIDPRTLKPAETEWLSVTVVATHAAEAEAYAKSLLIGGSHEANRISELNKDLEFIVIDRQSKLWGSKHSRELLYV
jgi:thiamine biosynthesis lipoprotein